MGETIIALADLRYAAAAPRVPLDAPAPTGLIADRLGRPLRDLRISVTDRCNFRCSYCMPKEVFDTRYKFLPHSSLLSFEEITRVARVFVAHGVVKLRLTGGEPLLRKNLEALDDATFRRMNDVDFPVADVLRGIEAALRAGLAPLKINMVVKRGTNDDQIVPLARHVRQHYGPDAVLRFIEYMDVGASNGWCMDEVLPSSQVLERLGAAFALEPLAAAAVGETAERWRYADGGGEIGVISSVTQAFCRDCNRARLSTEGKLFLCLFATRGHDLRALLRGTQQGGQPWSDAQIAAALGLIWTERDDRYSELRGAQQAQAGSGERRVEMHYIGG